MKNKKKKFFKVFFSALVFIFSAISLTSCDTEGLKDSLHEIGDKLIPNIWAFVTQVLAFVVLIIIVVFFAYKPVKKFMNKRKQTLDDQVLKTKADQEEASKNVLISKNNIEESKIKAQEIIKSAEGRANKQSEEIIHEANHKAQEIIALSKDEIEKDKDEAYEEVKKDIVDVAFNASSKILNREITREDNDKIVDDFVNEFSKSKKKKDK